MNENTLEHVSGVKARKRRGDVDYLLHRPRQATHEEFIEAGFHAESVRSSGASGSEGTSFQVYTNDSPLLTCLRCKQQNIICRITQGYRLPTEEWTFASCTGCANRKHACNVSGRLRSTRYTCTLVPRPDPLGTRQKCIWRRTDVLVRGQPTVDTRTSSRSERARRFGGYITGDTGFETPTDLVDDTTGGQVVAERPDILIEKPLEAGNEGEGRIENGMVAEGSHGQSARRDRECEVEDAVGNSRIKFARNTGSSRPNMNGSGDWTANGIRMDRGMEEGILDHSDGFGNELRDGSPSEDIYIWDKGTCEIPPHFEDDGASVEMNSGLLNGNKHPTEGDEIRNEWRVDKMEFPNHTSAPKGGIPSNRHIVDVTLKRRGFPSFDHSPELPSAAPDLPVLFPQRGESSAMVIAIHEQDPALSICSQQPSASTSSNREGDCRDDFPAPSHGIRNTNSPVPTGTTGILQALSSPWKRKSSGLSYEQTALTITPQFSMFATNHPEGDEPFGISIQPLDPTKPSSPLRPSLFFNLLTSSPGWGGITKNKSISNTVPTPTEPSNPLKPGQETGASITNRFPNISAPPASPSYPDLPSQSPAILAHDVNSDQIADGVKRVETIMRSHVKTFEGLIAERNLCRQQYEEEKLRTDCLMADRQIFLSKSSESDAKLNAARIALHRSENNIETLRSALSRLKSAYDSLEADHSGLKGEMEVAQKKMSQDQAAGIFEINLCRASLAEAQGQLQSQMKANNTLREQLRLDQNRSAEVIDDIKLGLEEAKRISDSLVNETKLLKLELQTSNNRSRELETDLADLSTISNEQIDDNKALAAELSAAKVRHQASLDLLKIQHEKDMEELRSSQQIELQRLRETVRDRTESVGKTREEVKLAKDRVRELEKAASVSQITSDQNSVRAGALSRQLDSVREELDCSRGEVIELKSHLKNLQSALVLAQGEGSLRKRRIEDLEDDRLNLRFG